MTPPVDLAEGLPIPADTLAAIEFLVGAQGLEEWVHAARRTYERLQQEWDVTVEGFLAGGQMSACLRVRHDGTDAVLKIPLDPGGGRLESAYLSWGSPSGAVPRVRATDAESGAFLMDYVAADGPDVAPAELVAPLLGRLSDRSGGGDRFPPLADNLRLRMGWARQRFGLPENAEGLRWFEQACTRGSTLAESSPINGVLHGDLQDKNILVSGARAFAIDPLPVFGDTTFDAAFWCVMSHTPDSVAERCRQLTAARPELDGSRLADWAGVIAAIEFRPYLPEQAAVLRSFLEAGR